MNREEIGSRLRMNEIPFAEDLPEKLEIYLRLLLEWNTKMDLTAVEEEEDLLDKHFADSLTVLRTDLVKPGASLVDVGTGAGFPGMVLAMARPDLHVVLMDAQRKRLKFLEAVAAEAGVNNAEILHARAEDAARDRKHREQYPVLERPGSETGAGGGQAGRAPAGRPAGDASVLRGGRTGLGAYDPARAQDGKNRRRVSAEGGNPEGEAPGGITEKNSRGTVPVV